VRIPDPIMSGAFICKKKRGGGMGGGGGGERCVYREIELFVE